MGDRKTRADRLDVVCTKLRLQMLYFDDVNDAGMELTKLKHQSGLYSREKLARCEHEMNKFATQNGFFFYDKYDQNNIRRAALTPANEQADLPEDYGSTSSYLESQYQSPNRRQIDDSNPNPTLNKWKTNILNRISNDRQKAVQNLPKKLPSPDPERQRMRPQRRNFSCPNLINPFQSDQSNGDQISPRSVRKRDRVAIKESTEVLQATTELRDFRFYLSKMEKVQEKEATSRDDEKLQLSPTRSIVASEGSNSCTTRRQMANNSIEPVQTAGLRLRQEMKSSDTLIVPSARFRMRKHSSVMGEPLSGNKLFTYKRVDLDGQSRSGSMSRQKPSLLQKSKPTSKMSLAKLTNNNLSSDKSDSGGSVENMKANLSRMNRLDIGQQKLKKLRLSYHSTSQVAQTEECIELKQKTSVIQPVIPRNIEKQFSVTRQNSVEISNFVSDRLRRSNSVNMSPGIFRRLTQLKIGKESSQSSKKLVNVTLSNSYRNKLEALRIQLETATWEKEPSEEEVEKKRLKTLYAHGRYLRQTARGVDNFMNDIFCQLDNWKQVWHQIGSCPAAAVESSSDSEWLYGEEQNSNGAGSISDVLQDVRDTPESDENRHGRSNRNQTIMEEESDAEVVTEKASMQFHPFQNLSGVSMPIMKINNAEIPRQNSHNFLLPQNSFTKATQGAALPRMLSLTNKRPKFEIKLEYNTINEQEDSPMSHREVDHPSQEYIGSFQEKGIKLSPTTVQDPISSGFAINLKQTEQQTEVAVEENKSFPPTSSHQGLGAISVSLGAKSPMDDRHILAATKGQPMLKTKPSLVTQQSNKMEWLDELDDQILDEPFTTTADIDKKKPSFGNSFSHALPKTQTRVRSEKKARRQYLSPLNRRLVSPSSCIDRNKLPTDISKFYQDLSSSDDSSISDHLTKLKTLFQGSNLNKNISRPSSRTDRKGSSASKSPPKSGKRNRGRNHSLLPPSVQDQQPMVRSQSHMDNRMAQTAKKCPSPYNDMLDMMRTTTNEFNKSQKSIKDFTSNFSCEVVARKNVQINITQIPQLQNPSTAQRYQVQPLNLSPVGQSSRQRHQASPQGNTNKKMSQQQGD